MSNSSIDQVFIVEKASLHVISMQLSTPESELKPLMFLSQQSSQVLSPWTYSFKLFVNEFPKAQTSRVN
jgi:hypothetical protein